MMFKNLLRTFISAFLAGVLYIFVAGYVLKFFPALPYGITGALLFAILVVLIEYILENFIKI